MNMSLDEYKIKAKKSELYNSYWKECKEVVENAIKENKDSCKITLRVPEGENILIVQGSIKMVISSLKNIYNCNIDTDCVGTELYILSLNWDSNTVIPYKDQQKSII